MWADCEGYVDTTGVVHAYAKGARKRGAEVIEHNRVVELKVLDRMDVALSVIRNMPETRDVQAYDHRVTVELAADDAQVAALLESLLAAGVRLR